MFRPNPRRASARGGSLALVLALLFNALPAGAARTPAAPAQAQAVETSVRVLSLHTNDIVYDKVSKTIFASVPSRAGASGNSVAEVDPVAGAVGPSVYVGSEPNRLAVSDDGQALYVGLDGAAAVRRVDLATRTAGVQFALGSEPFFSTPFLAGDLAVAPGDANAVAVAKVRPGVIPPGAHVAVYDNGVQRPNTASPFGSGPSYIAFGATASALYGSQQFDGFLQRMSVDASGVTAGSLSSVRLVGELQFENGRLYNERGQVYNPATDSLVGTFGGAGFGPFVVDAAAGRAYFVVNAQTPANRTVTLRAYDTNTFAAVGETTVGGVIGTPTGLVRWGANGLAFRTTAGQLFLIQTSLVPSADPVPAPTPTPEATPTPTPVNTPAFVRQLPLVTKDLVYSPGSHTLWASMPSSAGAGGNSVVQVDPASGAVAAPVFVGSEPNQLALSDDGQHLYVGLNGAASVRRFDTATQTPGPQFFLGAESFTGPYTAADIEVLPGAPQSVAVAKTSGSSMQVVVYDGATPRPNVGGGATDLEFGATAARLYGSGGNFTGGNVLRYTVGAAGVAGDGSAMANGGSIEFAGGLLYTANGSVVDPEANSLKGTFTGDGLRFNSLMAVDAALGRAYFLTVTGTTALLRVYDTATFLPIGQTTFTLLFTPHPDGFQFSSLVRWGENGLAFRTTTHVVIIQSTLVNPSGAAPEPTPTPTPAPTATPTPEAATFVRKVDLPARDVVYSHATQKLYVTVAGSAGGVRGNSITAVEPSTGELGASVVAGTEPDRLGLSDDGQTIYVGFDGVGPVRGPGALRRFDIATQTLGPQFSLGQDPNFGGPLYAGDIAVSPGDPSVVAVARYANSSPSQAGVAVYENGVQRPKTTPGHVEGSTHLAFSASPSTLYGGSGETGLKTISVDASGATVTSTAPFRFGPAIEFRNGLLYASSGYVADPAAGVLVGKFASPTTFGRAMAVDTTLGRAFFATDSIVGNGQMSITAFDLATFTPLGRVTLPFTGMPTRLVRWGANGLALRAFDFGPNGGTAGSLYLIQSALVSPAAPVPTGVMFSPQGVFTNEGNASVTVTALRTGGLSGETTVEYATADGTATERGDYTTAVGTLRFAPGEAQKTIRVLMTNDALQEGNESFDVLLSNAAGAQVVSPARVTVNVFDDDFSQPASNPIDASQFFVRQHYLDFFGRAPDSSGLNHWTGEIEQCGADAACREVKRINVSAAFFLSIEFQETGFLAYRLHQLAFGTGETLGMRAFMKDAQEIGAGVVVGQGDWGQRLEANKRAFLARFVARPAFLAALPPTLSPAEYVDALAARTADPLNPSAGGALTQAERDWLAAELAAGLKTRADVLRVVAENDAFSRRQFNRAFVYMQYVGYLRRNPNATPDTDFTGYNHWLAKLEEFGGNFVNAEMVKAFISSDEYRKRFGP